ncbi:MAG: hypothetical protein P3W93_004585 [Thermus sp.]|nr:hypothetical protein [Thermus sp.]
MRRYPLFFLVLLTSCTRLDTSPPEVALLSPSGEGVAPGKVLIAEGYAFDPSGVVRAQVNGQEVLPPEERGKRLVHFRFRLQAPTSGKVELLLEAEDARGNRGEKRVPLVLDAMPPRIVVERLERAGNLYRVYGRVEDNVQVDRVVVQANGRFTLLSLPKEPTVVFSVEMPVGAVLLAVDAAGNRTSRRIP